MKKMAMWMAGAMLAVTLNVSWADTNNPLTCPAMPQPTPEHSWLKQMEGEWMSQTESYMPNIPPVKSQGFETVRGLGGFWSITDVKGMMMEKPFAGSMTIGYDTNKRKYVATWVDTMTGHLWNYEGTLDASGKTLTLMTEGMCPMKPGKLTKFKEVIELKGPDQKTFTSYMEGENGQWMKMMTSTAQRVK